MWRRWIALILRGLGLGHWNPFLRVLANQGRPSPVFFPPELVDQGLSFALTGLTNTFAFQGHPSWALPWWAEQQVRPESPAFIPTGVNVLTVNLTHRNWTAVGLAGSPWKAMVDPCGMLTPRAFGPSWMPALALDGRTWIPSCLDPEQLDQELRNGWQNRVITRYRVHPDLDWSCEAMAVRHAGRDWVRWTHTLAWRGAAGQSPRRLAFVLGLRPYNALTLGPVFRSRVRGRNWSVNRQAALRLGLAPDAVRFGRDRTDPLKDTLAEPDAMDARPVHAVQDSSPLRVGRNAREAALAAYAGRPGNTGRSAETGRPTDTERSADTVRSVETGLPTDAMPLADAMLPDDTAPPAAAQPPLGRARSGWLAGVARWDLELAPGQPWTMECFALIPDQDRRLRWRGLEPELEGLAAAGAAAAAAWDTPPVPLGLELADPELATLARALVHHLAVFDNGGHFAPGAFFYNHAWLRDSSFLALAHDLWGQHGQVASKAAGWMATRTRRGDFRSHSGEWDGTGQTLFTWTSHALMTGSPELLARHWQRLGQGARWIDRTRRRERDPASPRRGLLPAGLSAEHFGPNDHYFWDNFWSLAGMDRLRLALDRWEAAPPAARKLAGWLDAATRTYRAELREHLDRLTRRHAGLLPCSPYRHPDAAVIGTLAALSPLDLDLGPEHADWARANVQFLMDRWVRDRLFYQPIIHTGGNAYLTAQLARALQCLGDPRWLDLLAGIHAHAGATGTWPEAIHPHTGGGCMGDGDHGWACAETLALIRLALVREQGGQLLLLPNAPEAWWRSGPMALDRAPTPAGHLSFRLVPTDPDQHTLSWARQRTPFQPDWSLILVIPPGWTVGDGLPAATSPWGGAAVSLPDTGATTLRRQA